MGVDTNAQLRNSLFADTMKGKWKAVVEKYVTNPEAHKLKLTQQGDTALHLAVIDNQEETVEKLVKLIRKSEGYEKVLETANERENNPLHLAAMMGSVRMCQAIASAHGKLVDKRNKANETPLFLAASLGNKNAFYFLYDCCGGDRSRITVNCRGGNKNEDTVLHSALRNQQLDLAFQFINKNEDAMGWVNGEGLTPLQILASNPTLFKLGTRIEGWKRIVYHWTSVDQLKDEPIQKLYKARGDDEDQSTSTREGTIASYFPSPNICFFKRLWDGVLKGGTSEIRKIRKMKEKHTWSTQVMKKLVEFVPHADGGGTPLDSKFDTKEEGEEEGEEAGITRPYSLVDEQVKFSNDDLLETETETETETKNETATAMLLAARNGVIEIVQEMYRCFPLTIRDTDQYKKNVVLLAAEYRQPAVYDFLLKNRKRLENLFRATDRDGNSALHLAANAAKNANLWGIKGVAMQMQLELKWYQYVKQSVPLHFFVRYNDKNENAYTIFRETHKGVVAESEKWLTKTSKSCCLVGTLIVTAAFTSAASVPGGFDDRNGGVPLLEGNRTFFIFAVFSLIALCLSSTSVVFFLSILTSRFDANYFKTSLAWKLFFGLSSLFLSIVSMLVSFCAGHYFLVDRRLQNSAVLLYTLIFLPVAFIFLASKLPLYLDLLQGIFKTVPSRSTNVVLSHLQTQNPSEPLQNKFKIELISSSLLPKSLSIFSIFTPTNPGSYPVIFFLPASHNVRHSSRNYYLRLIASRGFVIITVAPQSNAMPATSESQVKPWPASGSDQQGVEAELTKMPDIKIEGTKLCLTFGEGPLKNPFSAVIGFDPPPGTKFSIPHSQMTRTQPNSAPQSSNTSSPILPGDFLISKLCATVKLLLSQDSS